MKKNVLIGLSVALVIIAITYLMDLLSFLSLGDVFLTDYLFLVNTGLLLALALSLGHKLNRYVLLLIGFMQMIMMSIMIVQSSDVTLFMAIRLVEGLVILGLFVLVMIKAYVTNDERINYVSYFVPAFFFVLMIYVTADISRFITDMFSRSNLYSLYAPFLFVFWTVYVIHAFPLRLSATQHGGESSREVDVAKAHSTGQQHEPSQVRHEKTSQSESADSAQSDSSLNVKYAKIAFNVILYILALIAFFIPLNSVSGIINVNVAMIDKDFSMLFFIMVMVLFGGVLVIKHVESVLPDVKPKTLNTIDMVLFVLLSLIFWIEGARFIASGEYASISIGFAPFYLTIVTALAIIYFIKEDAIVRMITSKSGSQGHAKPSNSDPYKELENLKALYDKEIISEEEFKQKKEKLLEKI